jgi:hypothetical protein
MIVVVTDPALNELLASGTLISTTWPRAHEDVFVLVKVLQITVPTLAEVLSTGLINLFASNTRTSEITLATGLATLQAVALTQHGERVADPEQDADQVFRVDVLDVTAEGRSASKVAR